MTEMASARLSRTPGPSRLIIAFGPEVPSLRGSDFAAMTASRMCVSGRRETTEGTAAMRRSERRGEGVQLRPRLPLRKP
jgi:hypothetical protein